MTLRLSHVILSAAKNPVRSRCACCRCPNGFFTSPIRQAQALSLSNGFRMTKRDYLCLSKSEIVQGAERVDLNALRTSWGNDLLPKTKKVERGLRTRSFQVFHLSASGTPRSTILT